MSKRPTISLGGLIDPDAVPEPIPGVMQRGEHPAEPPKRGRPPKPVRENAKRLSVELDFATYRKLAVRAIDEGLSHQDLIDKAIRKYLRDDANE